WEPHQRERHPHALIALGPCAFSDFQKLARGEFRSEVQRICAPSGILAQTHMEDMCAKTEICGSSVATRPAQL
ncbi:hypothetical protein, partial [Escherichia coli]|uniref:hypothetical protein n=1 Tax=Escherichia coli TaxID=562 RepID=UPI001953F264